jgi:hypothetical protein
MSMGIGRILRWLVATLLLLLVLGVALVLLDVWPLISAEQRAAVARLQAPQPARHGINVTIPAWLVSRGVSRDQWPRHLEIAPDEAERQLARRPPVAFEAGQFEACLGARQGCLTQVRAATPAARLARAAATDRAAGLQALQQRAVHAAHVGTLSQEAPLPPYGALQWPIRLDATLRFIDGEQAAALEQLCRYSGWWRELRRSSDSLLAIAVAESALVGSIDSYAEMLSQLDPGVSIPAVCEQAFEPLADAELDLCPAMRSEYTMFVADLDRTVAARAASEPGVLRAFARAMVYDAAASHALVAQTYDYWCSDVQRARAARRAAAAPTPRPVCSIDGWFGNFVGCRYIPLDASFWLKYYERALDLDGRLRLAASAVWLRSQAQVDAATFERRPAALRDPRHAFDATPCEPRLRFTARHVRDYEAASWYLALPAPTACPDARPR